MNEIIAVSEMEKRIQLATKPEQTKQIESVSLASIAWAKEQKDYELFVRSWYAYVMARRKTTELVKPQIQQGRPKKLDNDVRFLSDFGFTYKQWNRRCKELEIELETVNEYFDEIVAFYDWHPSLAGLVKFSNGAHPSYNSGENEWYTPPEYIVAARKVLGEIELDPASSSVANRIVKAKKFYSKSDDGLTKTWKGKTWLNPPYVGGLIHQFVSKFVEHISSGDIPEGIVLVNNATETDWFSELVSVASVVVFPRGRVRFLDPRGNPGTPLQGQAVVYAGNYNLPGFVKEFSKFGTVMRNYYDDQ